MSRIRPFGDVRLEAAPRAARRQRTPRHSFLVGLEPFMLQPFAIAPVLAGEALKFSSLQFRMATQPIRNAYSGWWLETWLFYVRLSQMPQAFKDDFASIVIGASTPILSPTGKRDWVHHRAASQVSWATQCLNSIVPAYFRDEEMENYTTSSGGLGRHPLQLVGHSFWDSASDISYAEDSMPGGTTGWDEKWYVYQRMRAAKLTQSSYEEWLAMQGVQLGHQLGHIRGADRNDNVLHVPELLFYTKDYAHPQLTTNPADGKFVGNLQWTHSSRNKRSRAFSEPGFVIGCMALRAKTFNSLARSAAVDWYMHEVEAWMPQEYETDPHTSLKEFSGSTVAGAETGPLSGMTANYWLDRRDLFLHGDQFITAPEAAFDSTVPADRGSWSLVKPEAPTGQSATTWVRRAYPNTTDVANLFVTPGDAGKNMCDGLLTLGISSRVHGDATA